MKGHPFLFWLAFTLIWLSACEPGQVDGALRPENAAEAVMAEESVPTATIVTSPIATHAASPTLTATAMPSPTPLPTNMPTLTATPTATATPTFTPIPTVTLAPTFTPTTIPVSPAPAATSGQSWKGLPIMAGASQGVDDGIRYFYSVAATLDEVGAFYERESTVLGWQILELSLPEPGGYPAGAILIGKPDCLATVLYESPSVDVATTGIMLMASSC